MSCELCPLFSANAMKNIKICGNFEMIIIFWTKCYMNVCHVYELYM